MPILFNWCPTTIFRFFLVMRKSGNTRFEWCFFDVDFLQVFNEIFLLFDLFWQIVMRDIILGEWYFFTLALPKTISICCRSKIGTDIVNLPETQILWTLHFELISLIFTWPNLIYRVLQLEDSFRIRSKFFKFVAF